MIRIANYDTRKKKSTNARIKKIWYLNWMINLKKNVSSHILAASRSWKQVAIRIWLRYTKVSFFPARQIQPVYIRETSCTIVKDMTDQKYVEMSKQLNWN